MKQRKRSSSGCCGWFLVIIVLAGIAFAVFAVLKHKTWGSGSPALGDPKKYSDALKIAMQFFDIQKSGKLDENQIPWRGDSALKDGSEAKIDLSKGMYDAGDHMKFGFPMAFTATVLSWAILEYGDQMNGAGQLEPARNSLKWITDYLVNSHPTANVLYIQVDP
ncbi:PREDICTED: endoglucanase 10 [Erythranthe guttata]|uniref:endoglucanase 10 n=1 Tax=Erythranthe guttata TaxID=4155 RepID=UPI00064DD23C|nr:PREDICTED: endoglucanase 10 [Erythranthe guttata]|eukprot:XP_012835751.1 PREDICTED: endoglucanase 10 [Erythranthe guttata]